MILVADVGMFITIMFINNCPKSNLDLEWGCIAKFLGRFSFEPLKKNPLFSLSSFT
ncbi:hypothetical protein ACSBR1_012320 [Camellia fascicularis]